MGKYKSGEGRKMFLLDDFSNIPEMEKPDIRRSHLAYELKIVITRLNSKRQRDVLLYCFYEGCDQYKTGDILGISRNTVQTHIARGKKMLADIIKQEMDKLFETKYKDII